MWRKAIVAGAAVAAAVVAGPARPAVAAMQVTVSPSTGPPGTTFTVTGSGFAAAEVEIRWDSQSGPLLDTAIGPDFSVAASVPDDARPNSHPVVAVVRNGNAVSTSTTAFQVTPAPVEDTSTTTTPPPTAAPTTVTEPATTTPRPTTAAPVTTAPARSSPATASTATPDDSSTVTSAAPELVPFIPAPSTTAPPPTSRPPAPGARNIEARSAGRSSEAVRSPALLGVGLALVVTGVGFLAVRRLRPADTSSDLPFTS